MTLIERGPLRAKVLDAQLEGGLLVGLDDVLDIIKDAPAATFDVDRLADVVHAKMCGPFTTIDPQQCVHGRQRDVALARAIALGYAKEDPS